MPDDHERFRMDFIQEVVSFDEATGKVGFILKPNPDRYEKREREGVAYLYDRLDDVWIEEKPFYESLVKQLGGKPIYFQPPRIPNARQYIAERRPHIRKFLRGVRSLPTFEDRSEAFLESLAGNKLGFVILSIDIVGSTKLSTVMTPEAYNLTISAALLEWSEVIPKFHGHVLKYTGDGLIAYFPEPSFITKNDLALDCALTLEGLVKSGLNPEYQVHGLPSIDFRIGLDSGEAYVETIGSPATKQHKDILGAVVSLAAKIQGTAPPGGIHLGDVTERNLHTMWRLLCEPIELPADWSYRGVSGARYAIHRVKQRQ